MLHQGGRRVLWPLARKPPVTRRLGICTCGITPILLNLHVLTHSQYTLYGYAEFSTLSRFAIKFNDMRHHVIQQPTMLETFIAFLLLASAIVGGPGQNCWQCSNALASTFIARKEKFPALLKLKNWGYKSSKLPLT